jgi:F0F1-type ATP synthase assembly protein I
MPETPDQETNRKSGLAYAAALNLFASVIALSGVGWVVDRWLGTKPWFLAGGVVLGSIVGLYQFIRLSSKTL